MIKLIIFDFDGVIVDSVKMNIDFANNVLQHFGKVKLTKQNEKDAYTLTTREFHEKYLSDIGRFRSLVYAKLLFDKFKLKFKLNNNLVKLLEFIKSNNVKCAIVTNRANETYEIVDVVRVRHYFDLILTADDIQKPKPDPEGILKAVKHFKVKTSECVYVGDTDFDSRAAKSAGVKSVIINNNNKKVGDYQIKDLIEIKNLLSGVMKK